MNAYEARRAARKERQADRAERLAREASSLYNSAHKMAEAIPFGQPILVGHHSEKRDRNYRGRIHSKFEKAFELDKLARELQQKADTVSTAISSDDPDAPDKIRERIAALEATQGRMTAVNKAHKAFVVAPNAPKTLAMMTALSEADQTAIRSYVPAYSWEKHPFAPFQLTNNSGNIRRLKERLELLDRKSPAAPKPDVEGDGYLIREDVEDNRLLIVFDAIPPAERRTKLKQSGFKWSPTRSAWVRMLSNGARYAAEQALK